MTAPRFSAGLLGSLFKRPPLPDESDRELLERFTGLQDENAFAILVRRHGPLVLGLCRRLLRNGHDADDAFQATFLVLARKAGSIRRRDTLSSWLYAVAYRTAKESWARSERHPVRGLPEGDPALPDPLAADPSVEADRRELCAIVAEELHRLPAKFRAAILLCDLEGKTQEEAARQLGCPKGTILSRLSRGRDRLRDRLQRRGVALSTAALTAALTDQAAAAVPARLVEATLQGTLAPGGGTAAAGALAATVVRGMAASKLRVTALVLLAAATVAVAAWPIGQHLARPATESKSAYPDDFDMPSIGPFFDDFAGNALDGKKWLVAHKQWGGERANGGVVAENVSVAGGRLLLEAHGDRYTGPVMGVRPNGAARVDGRRVGAAIATRQYFGSGRFEARIKVCPRLGACSAIWTLHYEEHYPGQPRYQKKPVGGDKYFATNHEIDIELPGRPGPEKKDISFQHALFNTFTGENDDESTTGYTRLDEAQNDGRFHNYRFDWHTGGADQKKRVEFYIDDKLVRTGDTHVPDLPCRLWLGVWFPRDWAGTPDFDTEFMEVAWVRITPFREAGDRLGAETFADDGWARPALPRK
jgi:RNA polymerase sigma factor (sigma-70 family)